MHGIFFLLFCRDAGLHLGAGYRSDPANPFRVLFPLTCVRDARLERCL